MTKNREDLGGQSPIKGTGDLSGQKAFLTFSTGFSPYGPGSITWFQRCGFPKEVEESHQFHNSSLFSARIYWF